MLFILLFLGVHWYLSVFMQTFMQHRYASHGAFSMSKPWERFFYLLTYLAQGSSYISPRVYGIMHRMHHAYTDTEKDPHSPLFDHTIFKMMWRTRKVSADLFDGKLVPEPRFLKNLPDWPALDRFANSMGSRLAWIAVYVLIYVKFAPSPWWFLLLPVHILMVPIQGAIINWFAHKYGSKNFALKNTSTNLFKVDLLMMGEAYHNNHHKNPSNSNFGFRWYELDPAYQVMRFLAYVKVIRIHKMTAVLPVVSTPVIDSIKFKELVND